MSIQLPSQGTFDGYTNPVVRGYSPDPSICSVDKDYYMVTGTNLSFPDIPVWHSRDLVHWKRIGFCIAKSQHPWGPWEKCPHNPIIHQHIGWWHHQMALGHADFFEDHQGNSWAVCLGQRKGDYMDFCVIGRETFLFPVEWKDGWPYVDQDLLIAADVKTRTLPLQPWPEEPARDEFDQEELGLKWGLLTYPTIRLYSLTERPGYLRLYGQPSVLTGSQQVAYIGTRQKEMEGEFMTKMEFEPTGENEEAGIACYQTSDTKYTAFVTLREGQKVARIRKTVGDMVLEAGNVSVTSNEVYLKAVFDAKYFHFFISENGTFWTKIASGQANLISNNAGRTLGGIFLGLYASGNGTECRKPADFDWFESHFTEVKFGEYLSMQ